MSESSPILGYAGRADALKGERFQPFWTLLWLSATVGGIGLLITLIAMVAQSFGHSQLNSALAMFGLLWLLVGGLLTLLFALIALAGVIQACFFPVDRVRGIWCASLILIGILANLPLAMLCIAIGMRVLR